MSSPSLPSMRIILFSVLAPAAIQALVEKLESLGQHVLLLVISPGTRNHTISHYPQIVTNAPRGLDILVTTHLRRLPAVLQGLSPDLILVAGFPRKFPSSLLEVPRLGCVNWHPSLLPRYRGPEPIFWQFLNGETRVGLTFHRMDVDIDTGPILVQQDLELSSEDTMSSFFSKLLSLTLAAIPDTLQAVTAGIPGTPQPGEGASYAPHVTDAERWLNWSHPATRLQRQVCIWRDLGGVRAKIDNQSLLIHRAHVIDALPSDPTRSGSIVERSPEGIVVQTGEGALLIQEYSYEVNKAPEFATNGY